MSAPPEPTDAVAAETTQTSEPTSDISAITPPTIEATNLDNSAPPVTNDDHLEADAYPDDNDSTFGGSNSSGATSLKDSIRAYRELHGRTFHAYGETEYWGPNDETQNDQLDIGHHMLNLLLDNKLFLAPISSSPHRVIDVGTGTGIWAMDFADAHPSAKVIGTDLSPIQPTWVPPNLSFEIDDAQLDWLFPDNEFDFVHMRALMGSISD